MIHALKNVKNTVANVQENVSNSQNVNTHQNIQKRTVYLPFFFNIKKKMVFNHLFAIPFSFIPIDYLTTCDTKFATSKNESFTNSFANVLIGLFSITSNT